MKKNFLSLSLTVLLLTGCAPKISDTIDKFAAGINDNDVIKVSQTISSEAEDYDALSNNNWSGLAEQINNWRYQAPYDFSNLEENITGDLADVYCTVSMNGGINRPSYFQLHLEYSFLFFRSWKIKKWKIDASGNGFDDDAFRLQKKF